MNEPRRNEPKANVLIVDDNPDNLRFLAKVLTERGYKVRPVTEGHLALASAQTEPPDLILLDIMMPNMNGYEVCERLKADARTRDIPVIFISALDDTESKVYAFERGGVDYVTKPFQVGEVVARVKNHVTLCEVRKKLEMANRELQRSNEELGEFAYVISHDLQEPLRTVSSYLKLLGEQCEGELSDDAREFIWYAMDGAARMQRMIKALLQYCRVDTHGGEFVLTDCAKLLERALQDLSMTIAESNAVITHDALPKVWADKAQLYRVFQNLIANALKFRGEAAPQVHISASPSPLPSPQRGEEEWLFSVRDNGIGIDAEHAERVFEMFQRLHTREEYEGTGIGLAICKKIIERHGGRIWVESELGAGATFYFTLPVRCEGDAPVVAS